MTGRQRLHPSTPVAIPGLAGTSRETLQAELADYERQFAEAQQQATFWNQKMLVASGAAQACKALLDKLSSEPEIKSDFNESGNLRSEMTFDEWWGRDNFPMPRLGDYKDFAQRAWDAALDNVRERAEALKRPVNEPEHDWGDEWEKYIHDNAVNGTIDAILKTIV